MLLGKDGYREVGILEVQAGEPVALEEQVPQEMDSVYFELAVYHIGI